MSFCARCGRQQEEGSQFCAGCGSNVNAGGAHQQPMGQPNAGMQQQMQPPMQRDWAMNIVRALLIWFLWFIGSLIINYSPLRPQGHKSRTMAIIFLGIITFGIYVIVVALCNLIFDPNAPRNIGYHRTNR